MFGVGLALFLIAPNFNHKVGFQLAIGTLLAALILSIKIVFCFPVRALSRIILLPFKPNQNLVKTFYFFAGLK